MMPWVRNCVPGIFSNPGRTCYNNMPGLSKYDSTVPKRKAVKQQDNQASNVRYYFVTDKIQMEKSRLHISLWRICSENSSPNLYRISAFRNIQAKFNFISIGYITYKCAFPFGRCEIEARAILKKKARQIQQQNNFRKHWME